MRQTSSFALTKKACYLGYIVQAIVNNFAPLLFVSFHYDFSVSFERLALLSSLNFLLQLTVDLLAAAMADRIGYRRLAVASQLLSALGLIGFATLPYLFGSPYGGLLLATAFCSLGGGLLEVLISPLIEACPSEHKASDMSFLHSFYCWGQAGVVLVATLYFSTVGVDSWRWLSLLLALLPLVNAFLFCRVPMPTLIADAETAAPPLRLLRRGKTWLILLFMACAGASELAIAQWASAFAEEGLGVSKAVGDLAGPCAFALLMGGGRLISGRIGEKIGLRRLLLFSAVICLVGYLLAAFAPLPPLCLGGCALCGLGVAAMWPGILSLSVREIPNGGTFLFGIAAVAGDLGCMSGTGLVGYVSGAFGNDLKKGVAAAIVFPLLLLLGLLFFRERREDRPSP